MMTTKWAAVAGVCAGLLGAPAWAAVGPGDLPALKTQAVAAVDANAKLAQVMTDTIFSFGELGFQEVETSKYITGILEKAGFKVTRGVAGLPTGWTASWTQGTGGPTIAFGSDIDGIPKASQMPGVAKRQPMIEDGPGHGEGHNSGQAVNVVAALALKDLMQKNGVNGTLLLWPGVAEELLAGKAYMVRDGVFTGVDAVLFTHVGSDLGTAWGRSPGSGLVSVRYTFNGESAHAAGAPWRGRSALDGVELMNAGWNFKREHLRPQQRSHYVITDGGDQPNVVPSRAQVWYFFRETDFENIAANYATGNTIAKAAADMTGTTVTHELIGTAAPGHFNKVLAETAQTNIAAVGIPVWTPQEQAFARDVQKLVGAAQTGLPTTIRPLAPPLVGESSGGASDDIGDLSWNFPTIVVRYPSNIPGLPGHNWANAISMATPIAHKGVVAGAKVMAMTTLDLLVDPALVPAAKAYFTEVQTKDQKYVPMLKPTDRPHVEINADTMAAFRPQMRKFYYDAAKHPTYLQQLGVAWPPAGN
jgi:aminobenzoyl-glutamate utilization protein B